MLSPPIPNKAHAGACASPRSADPARRGKRIMLTRVRDAPQGGNGDQETGVGVLVSGSACSAIVT